MPFVVHAPPPALAPFVASLWHHEADGPWPHTRERVLPGGAMQLLINLHEDELRSYHGDAHAELRRTHGAVLGGPSCRPVAIDTAEQQCIVGVSFKPGGACVLRPLTPDPAIRHAIAALDRGEPVAAIGERLGLSPRRLIDRFGAHVGLTPKRFARVRRFQRIIRALARGDAPPWAELALACGYYDQSHCIHEFKEFSGLHPTAYAPRDPHAANHVVLPG